MYSFIDKIWYYVIGFIFMFICVLFVKIIIIFMGEDRIGNEMFYLFVNLVEVIIWRNRFGVSVGENLIFLSLAMVFVILKVYLLIFSMF